MRLFWRGTYQKNAVFFGACLKSPKSPDWYLGWIYRDLGSVNLNKTSFDLIGSTTELLTRFFQK
jgi:hypothetical protein